MEADNGFVMPDELAQFAAWVEIKSTCSESRRRTLAVWFRPDSRVRLGFLVIKHTFSRDTHGGNVETGECRYFKTLEAAEARYAAEAEPA